MSTSDQQGHGPLTRKQLREIRLTGSTPVISAEEAAAAAAVPSPPVPPKPEAPEPTKVEPAPQAASNAAETDGETSQATTRLTRRQVRERERSATGSVPVDESDASDGSVAEEAVEEAPLVAPEPEAKSETPASSASADDDDDDTDEEDVPAPVSASTPLEASGDVDAIAPEGTDTHAAVAELGIDAEPTDAHDDVLADVAESDDDDIDIADGERPTVNSAFGQELLSDDAENRKPFAPSFDELLTVGDSTGSQHLAPNTLIFNPSPGDGSLSGPVASTGEILVTGSYELPKGLGSQGHAHGTTDGKDVDAVLIDGELPPASSPTPIAASAAVSTIKPAGEVIRPPAPEKGNKLMLILAIVAGGLALALGVSLIVAFNSNVF